METREFPTAVIASISTGILLCDFGDMHEAAEYLMGHPIWTHHFADKAFTKAMRHKIIDQLPGFPILMTGVTRDNYLECVAGLEQEHGKTVLIKKGDGSSAMHPMEGLPENASVIAVSTD